MGVSIHFKGRIGGLHRIKDFQRDLIRLADELGWKYQDLTRPEAPHVVELLLNLHADCEPVFFLFDSDGILHNSSVEAGDTTEGLWCSVKTQYAPVETHVSLVGLLRYIQKQHIPDLEVVDEGGYWESEDLDALRAARDFVAEKIDSVGNALSELKVHEAGMNEDSISDLIEETVKKRMESEKGRLQ